MIDVWSVKAAIHKYEMEIVTHQENIVGLQNRSRKLIPALRIPYYESIDEERKLIEGIKDKKRKLEKMLLEYYEREGIKAC